MLGTVCYAMCEWQMFQNVNVKRKCGDLEWNSEMCSPLGGGVVTGSEERTCRIFEKCEKSKGEEVDDHQ